MPFPCVVSHLKSNHNDSDVLGTVNFHKPRNAHKGTREDVMHQDTNIGALAREIRLASTKVYKTTRS